MFIVRLIVCPVKISYFQVWWDVKKLFNMFGSFWYLIFLYKTPQKCALTKFSVNGQFKLWRNGWLRPKSSVCILKRDDPDVNVECWKPKSIKNLREVFRACAYVSTPRGDQVSFETTTRFADASSLLVPNPLSFSPNSVYWVPCFVK